VPVSSAYASHAGRAVTFGVRPEAVELGGSEGLEAEVVAVTPLNERVVLLLQTGSGWEFLASLPASAHVPDAGSNIRACFSEAGTHIFDRQTGERLHG
jgi:multiple sugar transport system ATP-binding protein